MPAYNASNRAIVQEIQIWVLNRLHQRLRLRARHTMNFQSPKFPKMYPSSNFGSHWKKMCSLSLFVFRWILVHFSFIMWIQRQDWSLCTKFFGSNTLFLGSLYSLTPFGSPFQFMDLTSLQETLPDHHTLTDYSGSLTEPWISQNSTMSYIPSGPQGSYSWLILLMHKRSQKDWKFSLLIPYLILIQEVYPMWQDRTLTCCKLLDTCTYSW